MNFLLILGPEISEDGGRGNSGDRKKVECNSALKTEYYNS